MSTGNSGAARLRGTLARLITDHTERPDVLELGTMQHGQALLCDNFQVPMPPGEYLLTERAANLNPPLAPGDVVLVAWVSKAAADHTDPVVVDRIWEGSVNI